MTQVRLSIPKGTKCALCGIRDAVTMDHIPPKGIFRSPRPGDLITVPACTECNSGASVADEEFKVGLSMIVGTDTPQTQALWTSGAMRTLAHNKRLHREVLSRTQKFDVHSAGGIYLGTREGVMVPKKPIIAVLERTIRGLYFHHYGECLGDRGRVDVTRMLGATDPHVGQFVQSLRRVSVADGDFQYMYGRAEDAPLSSIWFMHFYRNETVWGYTMDANDPWRPS